MSDGPGVSKPYPVAPGVAKYQSLVAGGFTPGEANQWADQQTKTLQSAGFKPSEIADYWGNADPHNAELARHVASNLQHNGTEPKVGTSPMDAFAAGWDMSVTGLVVNQKAPTTVLPENATIFNRVMAGVGQFAGDAPASVAGFFGGGAAGGTVGTMVAPGPGTAVGAVVGAGAGTAAVPEAGRQILLDAYAARDGKIKTWQDALEVVTHSLISTGKQALIGGIAAPVGGAIGGKVLASGATPLIAGGADAVAQAATATAVGGAMEGHVPDARDFTAGAIIALGFHGAAAVKALGGEPASRVQHNMETLYRQTGVPPWEAAARAAKDPVFKQELMAQDPNGDPVTPQFRNVAPGDPPPYKPAVRETGIMEDREAGWRGASDMKNVTPKPAARGGAQPSQTLLPAAKPNQVYATDVPHALSLLRQLEGSGDHAVSPAGAIGRYQIMPATARQYMGKDFDVTTLHDPAVNEAVATRVVTDLHKRFNGDMNAIAIAYNAGPGRAGQYMKAGPGTALEAIPDKTMRGGIRYESRPSRRDESFLPTETQHYLANERRRMGNSGDQGGPGEPGAEPKYPSFEDQPAGAGGGGGGEPPASGQLALEGPESERAKFWSKASEDALSEEMLRNIGEQPSPNGKLVDLDRILGQFVSELTPARRIDDRLIKAGEMDRTRDLGAEDMFRQTYASDTRAGVFVRYGAIDPITLDIKPGSTSVMDAVNAVKEDGGNMDGWTAYMLARRTVDKAGQGTKTGFNPDAAMALASNKKAAKKYDRATKLFNDVMDSVLAYSKDSGVHSAEQIANMKRDNPAYISMRRIMGDDESFNPTGRGFGVRDSLRKMEGSDRQIINPITATLDNIRMIVKMADRNRAIGHIIGMVERGEIDGSGLVKIEDMQTIKGADEKTFKPYGLPPEAADTYAAALAERASKGFGPNDFVFMRDGKAERWRAKDPAMAELMRKADSPGQANIVMKAFETFAKVERAGIVYSADFPVRNVLRDQLTTFINDPLHPPPFVTWLRGISHVIGQDKVFQDAVAKGALGSALVDMDVNWLSRDMDKVFHETGTWDGVSNAVKHPLEFFQIIAEKLDAASRVGYFLHAQGKGVEPIKAATMSRKAYIDFAEKGTAQVANAFARVIPFFRPTLLGLKQFGEAMRERPASTLAYATASIAVPSIALYALNYLQDLALPDDRKYANLPRWIKDNYFVTPEIAGVRIKLRYPQEAGVLFGGMTNRMMDALVGHDAHAFEGWAKTFLDNYLPPMLPPLAQTPIETITNHSFFTGQPLIPASMDKNSGYMQYTPNTSEVGKALSRALGAPGADVMDFSPIQFDAFVKGWTGQAGTLVLRALDVPFHESKKPWEVADIPFAGSFFVRNPGMSAQPIQTFYEQMGKLEAKSADFALAMKRAEGGNASEIDMTAASGQYAQAIAPIKQAIGVQAAAIQGVAGNKEMSDVEKRQAIDALLPQLIDTAKQGIKAMDSLPKKGEEEPAPGPAAPPSAPSLTAPAGRGDAPAPPPLPGGNRGLAPMV